jgi:hypothetical protein
MLVGRLQTSWCGLNPQLRILAILRDHVHLVFHVSKVGQFIIKMTVEQLDPEHELPLLVARSQVVQEL